MPRRREKRLANALAEARETLRATREEKSRFIGMVGHDLRNPLNGIMLSSEFLEETTEDPTITHITRMILAECRSMDNLIARFLDLAAIEAGTLKPEPGLVTLTELAQSVNERLGPRAEAKRIELELRLDPATAPVLGDARFCQEIIDSLLSNAIKFSPAATRVTLAVGPHPFGAALTIADQGPGFTAEDLRHLYAPLCKLSARPTGNEKSFGLGLSIVKQMVAAMGCAISVVTAPGQGATFQVLFPSAQEAG
jgi:hypothetical protein